jgi:hypothetical protein
MKTSNYINLRLACHFKVLKTTKQELNTAQNDLVVGNLPQNK